LTLYSGPSHATALHYLKAAIAQGKYVGLQMKQRGSTWRVWASGIREKRNSTMKRPKLGKWISAAKVRLTKKNGVTTVELRRTVKKRKAKKRRR